MKWLSMRSPCRIRARQFSGESKFADVHGFLFKVFCSFDRDVFHAVWAIIELTSDRVPPIRRQDHRFRGRPHGFTGGVQRCRAHVCHQPST